MASTCQGFADTLCAKYVDCGEEPFVVVAYGTDASCVARNQLECVNRLGSDNPGASVTKLQACASALAAASCDAFIDDPVADSHYTTGSLVLGDGQITECHFGTGSLSKGAACFYDEQCQSGACSKTVDPGCGVCATVLSSGEACSVNPKEDPEHRCGPGLWCMTGNCSAVTLGNAGDTCGPQKPCEMTLYCDQSTCHRLKPAGASCTLLFGECDQNLGLFCNPASSHCEPVPLEKAGQHCYPIGDPDGGSCSEGASCLVSTPDAGDYVCVAPAADEAACGGAVGTGCHYPAFCIAGVCHLPGDLTCLGGSVVDPGDADAVPDGGGKFGTGSN